jgi:hypothetical protein
MAWGLALHPMRSCKIDVSRPYRQVIGNKFTIHTLITRIPQKPGKSRTGSQVAARARAAPSLKQTGSPAAGTAPRNELKELFSQAPCILAANFAAVIAHGCD